MKPMILSLFLALALAGCAAPKGGLWCHDDLTAAQFEHDRYECQVSAKMQAGEYGWLNIPQYQNECMRRRGYYGCEERH